ncbi:hypothetical protein ACP4OV_010276 [Aristida adscensionis]
MSSLSSATAAAASWWEEWQMRVLVLTSLGIQFVLFFIVVAIYVFHKSWSSTDKRMLAAAILLFISAILRGVAGSFVTKRSSFQYIQARTQVQEPTVAIDTLVSPTAARGFDFLEPIVDIDTLVTHVVARQIDMEMEMEMEMEMGEREREIKIMMASTERAMRVFFLPQVLCLDYVTPPQSRLACLDTFLRVLDERRAYQLIEDGLSTIFSRFYNSDYNILEVYKFWPSISKAKFWAWILGMVIHNGLLVPVIALFHLSHKQDYHGADIKVTFVLLYGTLWVANSLPLALASFKWWRWQWPTKVPQHSLLGFFIQSTRHTILMAIASCFGLTDLLGQYWALKASCSSCFEITTLVRKHVKNGWLHRIKDVETYQRFTDTTGEWAFQQEGCEQQLGWSSRYPLDESVLVWHLATDLCFYLGDSSPDLDCTIQRSREISNYMVYLLFANPEMLSVGSRASLFGDACAELKSLIGRANWSIDNIRDLVRIFVDCTEVSIEDERGSRLEEGGFTLIRDAWKLAKALRDLRDQEKMWRVIRGVWLEMLCFSASRSRGYLHVKSLGSGGEYLSYVWLLLGYAGMETFPDKLQKRYHRQPVSGSPEHELTSHV